MKDRWKKFLRLAAAAVLMSGLLSCVALASTETISSVSVRVGTDVTFGSYLNENIQIYTDSEDSYEGTYAATTSSKYYIRQAEWITSTDEYMKIGEQPRMRLYLCTDEDEHVFRSSYGSSGVTVKGGTFVSARRDNGELEVVVRLNGIKGQYPAPEEAYWSDSGRGRAIWNQVTEDERDDDYSESITSGYYDVYLIRGSKVVKKLEDYKGTKYNFYPYMTAAGDYKFRVRTVPHTESEKTYGKKSEWMESEEFYISKDEVSDGTGQVDDSSGNGIQTTNVGWIQSNGGWYYRYPDGSYQKNAWMKINGIWYLFDSTGKMMTGWQTKDGLTYYLQDNGSMYSGWIKSGNSWYYLNKTGDGGIEGAMRVGWLDQGGKRYYLTSSGAMAEGWTKVGDNWHYFYPGYGYMAANTTIDTFYVDSNGIWKK